MDARRRCIRAEVLARASRAACEHIARASCFAAVRHVASYAALPWEVDPGELEHVGAHEAHPEFYYPCVEGEGLVFRRARRLTLRPGRFGIPEPPSDAPSLPDDVGTVILVPGMAFDRRGHRLGSGKGFYDRTLSNHPDAIRVGVGLETLIVDAIPDDPWDIPMDAIATEQRFHIVGSRAVAHPGDTE